MHLEIPPPSKVIDLPRNQPLFLLTCTKVSFPKMTTRWQQICTLRTHCTMGLATRFLPFLLWDAVASTVLILPNNVTRQHIHHFVPLPSAIFQATSPWHLPTTFYILEQRNLPGAIPQNGNFSPLREFWKGSNKWQSKGAGWVRAADEPEQPGCDRFFLVTTENACSILSEDYGCSADKFRTLSLWWCFPLVWWGAALVGSDCLVFSKGAPSTGLPNDPTVYTASPPLDADHTLEWVVVVPSVCPRSLSFHISAKYQRFIPPPPIYLGIGRFSLCFSRELGLEMQSRGGNLPPCLTSVEPKHQSN